MVGKIQSFNFTGLRERLSKSISHESQDSSVSEPRSIRISRRHVPLVASPLDPKATEWLKGKHETGNFTLKRRPTIAQFEANKFAGGLFRKQHEASTLELFFDLFFVANLAVFTENHEQTNGRSLSSYVGFFAILWSTWFNISIFDVRFYVDSLFNRFVKLVTFGVFIAFTGLGPVYKVIDEGGTTRAFHGLALVLMVSRLMLLLQYATVLWFVRPFKKTVLPLCLMMLIYLAVSMGFLATYLDQENASQDSSVGLKHVAIWYGIIGAEAILTISVSIFWRILSFRHTHLVERVGLLTLIIMGEGIIGLTKSVSYMVMGTSVSVWSILGKIVAAVTLIYEVYILYFSPIEHDRFGTIRQQIWTVLHFPLHVALLLTEEGSATTILWDQIVNARHALLTQLPSIATPSNAYNGTVLEFTSSAEWIEFVNSTMELTASSYNYLPLEESYDWNPDLETIANISAEYGSSLWNEEVVPILSDIVNSTTAYFFENFNFQSSKELEAETDPNIKVQMYYDAYTTTYTFFFSAGGALLLLLAAMFWISKNHKTKEEYALIFTRSAMGILLVCLVVVPYTENRGTGYAVGHAGWIVAIVTFSYLFVVLTDNYISAWVDWRNDKKKRMNGEEGSTMEKGLHGKHADALARAANFSRPVHNEDHDDHDTVGDEHHHLVGKDSHGQRPVNHKSPSDSSDLTHVDTSYTSASQRNQPDNQNQAGESKPPQFVTFDEPLVSPMLSRPEEGYHPPHAM